MSDLFFFFFLFFFFCVWLCLIWRCRADASSVPNHVHDELVHVRSYEFVVVWFGIAGTARLLPALLIAS